MLITLITSSLHLFLNILCGFAVLNGVHWDRNAEPRSFTETCVAALLVGMLIETLGTFVGMLLGFPHTSMALSIWIIGLGLFIGRVRVIRNRTRFPRLCRVHWFEWGLGLFIIEKVGFGLWQLIERGLLYEDGYLHWARIGRLLYSGINWSLDPTSDHFLGDPNGKIYYPLHIPIWRANAALLNSQWNDLLAGFDSIVYFLLIVASVWLMVFRFSSNRRLAAIASLAVVTYPLIGWHMGAGFADLPVASYGIAAVAALLRREWILAGFLIIGTAWTKNDGLALFIPALLAGLAVQQVLVGTRRTDWGIRIRAFGGMIGGMLPLLPWLWMRTHYELRLTPSSFQTFQLYPEAFPMIFRDMYWGTEASWHWWTMSFLVVFPLVRFWKDSDGRTLLTIFFALLVGVVTIFSGTDLFVFLENKATFQRSLLQIVPIGIVCAAYGGWLMLGARSRLGPIESSTKRGGIS